VKESGDQAIAACTRAINSGRYSGRQLAAIFTNRCIEWNVKQESDKGIEDCSQAIRLYPNYANAFFNRGIAYKAKVQYDRAIEDFDQAIRLNSNHALAFFNRGNVYHAKGEYDRAIEDYDQTIRINPNYAIAFYNRGTAYKAKGVTVGFYAAPKTIFSNWRAMMKTFFAVAGALRFCNQRSGRSVCAQLTSAAVQTAPSPYAVTNAPVQTAPSPITTRLKAT